MMSKPDNPTITIDDSDNTTSDENLFGVNTTSKLKEELQKLSNEPIVTTKDNNIISNKDANNSIDKNLSKLISKDNEVIKDTSTIDLSEDFEIVFDDPTLENSSIDGGAITEDYESPVIKINDENKKD